jgi:NAD kinase
MPYRGTQYAAGTSPVLGATHHALNDAVLGRAAIGRPPYVEVYIDGVRSRFTAATRLSPQRPPAAAYSLSAGGPSCIRNRRFLLACCAASRRRPALVLPPDTVIDLMVTADSEQ